MGVINMDRELVIVTDLVKSLEESVKYLEECYPDSKKSINAYRLGRVQGMKDCISTMRQLFYLDKE